MDVPNCNSKKSNLVITEMSILIDFSEEIKCLSQSQREFFKGCV